MAQALSIRQEQRTQERHEPPYFYDLMLHPDIRLICIRTALICGTFASVFAAVPGRAVVLAGGDGTQNTSPPAVDDFGFANVGRVFNTADGFFNSGVYLGHGWVLSAYHPVRTLSGGFQFG